jgi:hypothetical protein
LWLRLGVRLLDHNARRALARALDSADGDVPLAIGQSHAVANGQAADMHMLRSYLVEVHGAATLECGGKKGR